MKIRILIALLLAASVSFAQTAAYPSAVTTDAQLKVAVNNFSTKLRAPATASDTVLTVASTTGIVVNMLLTIDNEIVNVNSIGSGTITVTRGFDGTTAAAHSNGRTVASLVDAWHHNALKEEIKSVQNALGPNLANLPGNAGSVAASAYNFAAIQPGVSLLGGGSNQSISLAACPAGVAATNTLSWLYIDQVEADTAYTITGAVSSAGLIRITSPIHGLATGNFLKLTGVLGVPANGGWRITVLDPNSFTLDGSVFSGSYTSGGTAFRGDEPVQITGGTCLGNLAAGTVIVNVGNPHTSTYSLKSATGGLQEAVNVAGASGTPVRLGQGMTFYGPMNMSNSGTYKPELQGNGRWISIVSVDPGFPMTALGVFILHENSIGQTLKNFKITFTQPDLTDLNSYTHYPPAVYGKDASRTEITGLLVERAWDSFDFRYNAGGSTFSDVWGSGFGKAFRFDGALDTIRIDGLHYWPFSLTANQSTAMLENDAALAFEIGRVDDLKILNSLVISGKGADIFTGIITAGDPVISITNTSFDNRARIIQRAGEVRFVNSYITQGVNAPYPGYTHTGGTFTAVGSWFYHVTPQTQPLFSLVANGSSTFYPARNSVSLVANKIFQYGGTGAPTAATIISANPTVSTDLEVTANRWQLIENLSYVSPKITITGSTNAVIAANTVSGKGAGTGDFLFIASDTNNRVFGNMAAGWTATFPAAKANGTYEWGTLKYGLNVQAPGTGGIGSVFTFYGSDATKRKSLRINESTGALEILNSSFNAVIAQINDDGSIGFQGVGFSGLGSATGTFAFCHDCAVTSGANNACTSGGTGAMAMRLAGVWRCFNNQN